jgi:hypothetical protein
MNAENGKATPVADEKSHHEREWKLNVQNVVIKVPKPEIVVREALNLAGFDSNAGWIIVLKVHGEPKKEVDLSTTIDLRHQGIEKLRLTPKHINNGDAVSGCRREFALLPVDEAHLSRLRVRWDTIACGGRRWLILRSYLLPSGYTASRVDIAIDVPASYPGAQLDMFYCHPHLRLTSGGVIPQTEAAETIEGVSFQRWSRHRPWDAARDNLTTHLALIDESLQREVER